MDRCPSWLAACALASSLAACSDPWNEPLGQVQGDPAGVTSVPSVGQRPIEPGVPQILAKGLMLPARLEKVGDALFYPNRVGYPFELGKEQLWSWTPEEGAKVWSAPGDVTGSAAIDGELWVAASRGQQIPRFQLRTGQPLPAVTVTGNPVQLAANGRRVYASLSEPRGVAAVVAIDPATQSSELLWRSTERDTLPVWLHAAEDSLTFTYGVQNSSAGVVTVDLNLGTVTTFAAVTGLMGGAVRRGAYIYYAHHADGEVRRIELASGEDTLLASIPGAWSLLLEGNYVYVGARPQFCSDPSGSVVRVALADGALVTLAAALPCPAQLAVGEEGLYWIANGTWVAPSLGPPTQDGELAFLARK